MAGRSGSPGVPCGRHALDEASEQVSHIVRARGGLGVPLETEDGAIGQFDALDGLIEQ